MPTLNANDLGEETRRNIATANLTDRQFLYQTQKMDEQRKAQFFQCERERIRSFAALWPLEGLLNGVDLAAAGFFYTGASDRVQCPFCLTILHHWESGDRPLERHRATVPYCRFALGRPCGNIPYVDDPSSLGITKESIITGAATGILRVVKPASFHYAQLTRRLESYKEYPKNALLGVIELAVAGFCYTGKDDQVKCFQCDGKLGEWRLGDSAWEEHAKWFPHCSFLINSKGVEFIKQQLAQFTPEELAMAQGAEYKKAEGADALFDASSSSPKHSIDGNEAVKFCRKMGHSDAVIKRAIRINGGLFENTSTMVECIYEILSGNVEEEQDENDLSEEETETPIKSVTHLVKQQEDLSDEESDILLKESLCRQCNKTLAGAVVTPCGCLVLCQPCSKQQKKLPKKCPKCSKDVTGAVRVFLS